MVYRPKIDEKLTEEIRRRREEIENSYKNELPKNAKCTIENGKKVWYQEIDNDVIVLRRE